MTTQALAIAMSAELLGASVYMTLVVFHSIEIVFFSPSKVMISIVSKTSYLASIAHALNF